MNHRGNTFAAQAAGRGQGLLDAVVRAEIAINDVIRCWRWMRRPLPVEAEILKLFPNAIDERTADQLLLPNLANARRTALRIY